MNGYDKQIQNPLKNVDLPVNSEELMTSENIHKAKETKKKRQKAGMINSTS